MTYYEERLQVLTCDTREEAVLNSMSFTLCRYFVEGRRIEFDTWEYIYRGKKLRTCPLLAVEL